MSDETQAAYEAACAKFPTLTPEMAQAVIEAYDAAHNPVYLTNGEKADLASRITIWGTSSSDAVQDVFDEVAKAFIVRRRGSDNG